MRKLPQLSLLVLGASMALSAGAQTPDPAIRKMLDDQEYCFAISGMANMSVLWRNSGRTLEEQLERRKKSLGESTPEYALVQDITKQIYEKDIRDTKAAVADTHASCLDAKGHTNKFTQKAIRSCPLVGLMVGEVSALRKRGVSVEQIASVLGDRYGELPKTYEGGLEKLAAKYTEDSKPQNGSFDYLTCMVLGMAAQ